MDRSPATPGANIAAAIVLPGEPGPTGTSRGYTGLTVNTLHGTLLNPAPRPGTERCLPPNQPPRMPRFFRGRIAEQAILQNVIAPGGGAWVYGPGGCGAAALLAQVASTPTARMLPDGLVCVVGQNEPHFLDDCVQRIFSRFYTGPVPIKVGLGLAQAYLEPLQALLICERLPLSGADQEYLTGLLPNSTLLMVAAGSPAPPRLRDMALRGLERPDALALCQEASRLASSGSPAPAATLTPLLERLCAELANLPLPLLLVCRLARGDPQQIERFSQMLNQPTAAPDPLVRVVQLVLAELPAPERATLAALVGAGGADASREALAAISQQPGEVLEGALTRLLALGLVTEVTEVADTAQPETPAAGNQRRVAIQPLVMWQALNDTLHPTAERARAAAYFAQALATHAGDLDWQERERTNLVAAANTALLTGDMQGLGVLARGLQPLFVLRGLWRSWEEAAGWAQYAARATGNEALRAWALHEYGTHAGLLGNRADGIAALTEAMRLRYHLGDAAGVAASRHNLVYLNRLPPSPAEAAATTWHGWPRLSPWQWLIGLLPVLLILLVGGLNALVPAPPVGALPPVTVPPTALALVPTASATLLPTPAPVLSASPVPGPTNTLPVVFITDTPQPSATPAPPAPRAPDGLVGLTPTVTASSTSPPVPTATSLPPIVPPPAPAPAYPAPTSPPAATPTAATPSATPTAATPTTTATAATPSATPSATPTSDGTPTPSATATSDETTTPSATATSDETPTSEPTMTATPDDTTAPAVPVLNTPEEEAELACGETVTLAWDAVEDESGIAAYEWEVETSESGTEDTYTSAESGNSTETSAELTDLACGVWYRWRVRAVDAAGNTGDYADYATFALAAEATPTPTPTTEPTPDTTPPSRPNPVSPSENAEFVCGDTVELVWAEPDDPSGIDRYEWEIFYSTGGRNGTFNLEQRGEAANPSVNFSDLPCRHSDPGETWYRWQVRAIDTFDNRGDFFDPPAYFKLTGSP